MNKKIATIAVIAVSGAAVLCFILWGILSGRFIGGVKDRALSEEDIILKDAKTLDRLKTDKSSGADKKLAAMSARKDAVGYLASLYLAERYSLNGKDAANYFSQALGLYDTKDIQKEYGRYLESRGKYDEAAKVYYAALPDEDAISALVNLKASPDVIGELLIDKGLYGKAVDYLKSQVGNTYENTIKFKIQKQYSIALIDSGKYNDALHVLEGLKPMDTGDTDLEWWYGRCLEALNQKDKAKVVYSAIGERGAYRLGTLLENDGNLKGAAVAYTVSNEPDSIWKGARIWDEMGDRSKAIDGYTKLSSMESVYQDDAAYRAYILKLRLNGTRDDDALSVLSRYPGWMVRLKKEPQWVELPDISYGKPDFIKKVEIYRKAGRREMADIELAIGQKNADLPSKLYLGDWYLSAGDNYQAVKWGLKAINDQSNRHGYELAYMKPFEVQVKSASKEFNVDPNLVWALMREESYFNKNAVSKAGALGLMQLMPSTGKYIASKLKVDINETDLLDPAVNIRFGTYYLKTLLDMFSGDADKALAAYNGGSGNVRKWSSGKIGSSKEDFPTAVAFMETREYITKVMNSYYIYQKFYK